MIQRELYVKKIRPFINNDLIKVLTGIRRCGKSVMLELIQEELVSQGISSACFISLNFEQMRNKPFCTAQALHREIERRISLISGKAYLFLDEIQEVEDWEQCVNSCRTSFDCDIYLTGSNARLLSGELATYLAGRYVEFVIYPFSFQEYLTMRKQADPKAETNALFREYVQLGGMPFLANLMDNQEACFQYLEDLYRSAVLKDVIQRNRVRDTDLLERISTYLLANIGHTFSATSLSKYFKSENRNVATETILNYIKYCQDAFLFYKIPREDLIGKKTLTVNEKYYVVDHGFREALYGQNTRDMDQTLENIVCLEALRRGYNVAIGKKGNGEIDFVLTRGRQRLYIQVAYLLASPETVEREFGIYRQIPDNYPKYVVSLDEWDMSRDGIRHCNLRDFLLMEEWE